jgi:flagellin-like protein
MNVFGQSERSWRKARKRAVSPIIATILLVAITVVLAAVLYVLISGLTHGPGSTPIGSAFTAGNPVGSTCVAGAGAGGAAPAVATAAALGFSCITGHYVYTLTVEQSTVSFGSILCEVKTAGGGVYGNAAAGSFSVLNIAGAVVATEPLAAAAGLAMPVTWTAYSAAQASNTVAYTNSVSLTSLFTIVIDTGSTTATTGQGLSYVALGTGSFSGTTGALALP